MKKLVSLIILLFPFSGIFAQQSLEQLMESGKKQLESGFFSEAADVFDKAIDRAPDFAEAKYYLGLTYLKQQDYQKAIEILDQCLAQSPNYFVAYYLRGLAKDELGQNSEAIEDYNLSMNTTSSTELSKIYVSRGRARKELNKYEEAKSDLDTAIQLNPQNAEAYYERSLLKYLLPYHGKYAIKDADKSIELSPSKAQYYARRSFLLIETYKNMLEDKPKEQAVTDASKAIELEPKNPAFYEVRSQARFIINEKLGALSDLNQAVALSEGDPVYYNKRGLLKMNIGNYQGAVEDFSAAITRNPDMEFIKNRGLAYYNNNQYQESIEDYSKVISHFEDYFDETAGSEKSILTNILHNTMLLRGFSYIALGAQDEACKDFNKSNQLVSDPKVAYYLRRYCRF